MKTPLLALAILAALSVAGLAAERTITTRSGVKYEKAEVSYLNQTSAKVTHADGITNVPLEDMPADIQKELGYVTLADRKAAQEMEAKRSAESDKRERERAAAEDKVKKDKLAAIPSATQAEANSFHGLKESDLLARFGKPIKTTTGSHVTDGKYKMLIFDETKGKETFFDIWDSDGFVNGGLYKGVYVLDPSKKPITAADLKAYIAREKEKEQIRRGAIELLKKLGEK